jgi:hypothetical protein
LEDALKTSPDVFVEYTKPDVAKFHISSALKSGAHVVVGTSGLSSEDYDEINGVAKEVNRGLDSVMKFQAWLRHKRCRFLMAKQFRLTKRINTFSAVRSKKRLLKVGDFHDTSIESWGQWLAH